MDLGFTDEVALITGGTAGIGRAVAQAFLAEGCRVAVTGRSPESTAAAGRLLAPQGERAVVLAGDLADPATPARLVAEAVAHHGRLDILVNNAASFTEASVFTDGYEPWDELFRLKVGGYVGMIREAVPHLRRVGGGAIVNVAGIAGVRPIATVPHTTVVNAGVIALTGALARDLAAEGIRVNTVTPGNVRTGRFERRVTRAMQRHGWDRAEAEQQAVARVPRGAPVEPDEVALMVVTMCSPRLRSLVGAHVVVDGGWAV